MVTEKEIQATFPKIIIISEHDYIVFLRESVIAFPITPGPEIICRGEETLLIRTVKIKSLHSMKNDSESSRQESLRDILLNPSRFAFLSKMDE